MLSDTDIRNAIKYGDITILPTSDNIRVGPDSIDVHLDSRILIPRRNVLDESIKIDPSQTNHGVFKGENLPDYDNNYKVYLHPGEAILGATYEMLSLNSRTLAADIAGCSGLARWFIMVHVTAGFIDSGWGRPDAAPLTVEIVNVGPFAVRLWAGMRIGQLRFWRTESAVTTMYNERSSSEYKDATGPQESHYHVGMGKKND